MKRHSIIAADPEVRRQFNDWYSILDTLKDSNLAMQNQLSAKVRHAGGNMTLLESLERILDGLLLKDVHISLLRRDIKAQEIRATNGGNTGEFWEQQEKLQDDVTRMSREFNRLKSEVEWRIQE